MSESTGTIIGEQLRQEMQAMRRDAERFRALAMACELHFSADEKRAIGMLQEVSIRAPLVRAGRCRTVFKALR